MRNGLFVLWMVLCSVAPAAAQVSDGSGFPNLSIEVNLPLYPVLAPVPRYPVYYAPRLNSNYFFYDGMYWVYQGDQWYASSWYNGPWALVAPEFVPVRPASPRALLPAAAYVLPRLAVECATALG